MANIFSKWIEQRKINKQIKSKYKEMLAINKKMAKAEFMKDLLSYFEQEEEIFDEIEKIDVGYKKIVRTSKEDIENTTSSQLKKKYFSTIHHYLMDFNESDSLGYINGFVADLKSCSNSKYSPFIKSFINDAQAIVDNHSIIYNNYRRNPIKFYTDELSGALLEYVCGRDEVSEEGVCSRYNNISYSRVSKLFDYYTKQKILSERKPNGKKDVLIHNPLNVFSSGLNPNELSYFSVTYNYAVSEKNGNKPLLEIIDSEMSGPEFEKITKEILENNGFENIEITPISGDFGVDVIAIKDSVKYVIQCKRYSSTVGIKAVQEVIGSKAMNNAHVAVVLTNNYFTKSAIELAEKNNVLLWDRKKLEEMINKLGKK